MSKNKEIYDVIIIGGGIVGCSAAYYLAKYGVRSLVLERDTVAGHASGFALGSLNPLVGYGVPDLILDYGLKSLFKPSEISNYNNETEKLEPNTEYLYRITPYNDAGEGLVSKVVNAITITERIDIAECSAMQKDNLNDDFTNFNKYW